MGYYGIFWYFIIYLVMLCYIIFHFVVLYYFILYYVILIQYYILLYYTQVYISHQVLSQIIKRRTVVGKWFLFCWGKDKHPSIESCHNHQRVASRNFVSEVAIFHPVGSWAAVEWCWIGFGCQFDRYICCWCCLRDFNLFFFLERTWNSIQNIERLQQEDDGY